MPTIKILFFAAARELAGDLSEVTVTIDPPPADDGQQEQQQEQLHLNDVRAHLAKNFPGLAPIIQDVTLALNMEYISAEAEGDIVVGEGDEVALIPPISGG